MDKVRIGLVGTGFIGEFHLRSLLQIPQADVVAICDTDGTQLQNVGGRYQIRSLYTDQAEMLAKEALDAILIATPDDAHRAPVELAAKAGVHILLEKPIATTVEDAQAILSAVDAAGVKLQLGFTMRYSPTLQDFHRRLDQGWFGDLTMGYTRRACPLREARRLKGRVTANQYLGIHDIDILLWFFGPALKEVYATRGDFALFAELGVADYYWTLLKWQNGATAAIYVTWAMPDTTPNYVETELLLTGTKSAVHFDSKGQIVRLFGMDTYSNNEAFPDIYLLQDQAFVEAVIEDRAVTPDGRDGLNALRVIQAAEESARSGRPVSLGL